jgi:hypothetical protein
VRHEESHATRDSPPNILTEHGGSRGAKLGKSRPVQGVPCRGTAGTSVVEGQKSKTVNCEKWRHLVSISLTVAGGRGNAAVDRTLSPRMKTKSDKRVERGRQRTAILCHTEETQNGRSPIPPNIGITSETGSKYNKRIRWGKGEMK